MHILLISECEKRALKKTRAVLDSYACRVGQRTWATPITQEALGELHAALRRVATRQTAVACWQNEAGKRMRLLWVVGARGKFATDGAVAVGSARTQRRRHAPLAPWLRLASLLAAAAGLMHDVGKASQHFQHKLRAGTLDADAVRHEWLSVCLLRALQRCASWGEAWSSIGEDIDFRHIFRGDPRRSHAPASAAETLEYLVGSHHKLFAGSRSSTRSGIPELFARNEHGDIDIAASHIRLRSGTPLAQEYCHPYAALPQELWLQLEHLQTRITRLADEIPAPAHPTQLWWAVCTVARAALIFADHTVSARTAPIPPGEKECAANTKREKEDGSRSLNQPLAWHLQHVSNLAAHAVWHMGHFLNPADTALAGLSEASLAAILAPAESGSRFDWQNRAAGALTAWRQANPGQPCLVLNLAGTGSGKTRMNLRAACLLSLREAPRVSIALNLRSLTLQTGHALEKGLGLQRADIATVIGDALAKKLFDAAQEEDDEDNTPPDDEIECSGEAAQLPGWLDPFLPTGRERTLLAAPLLVSTIDFLHEAGNPGRQGHHVKALLRLMGSDLVLDEIDGYDPTALVAVLRLVQLAAFFGRNLICSSATLSMPVAQALHAAWISGWHMRHAAEGKEAPSGIALIDDLTAPQAFAAPDDASAFAARYGKRLSAISAQLQQRPPHRRAFLQTVSEPNTDAFFDAALHAAQRLHSENAWEDARSGKRLSFGLVRMANISGAIDMARHLAKEMPHAHIACYHAGDWRISRFHKEQRLDFLLTRKGNGGKENAHILEDAEIRTLLEKTPGSDAPFIVVATPVEEIGRDHDFDWAVIEPSSAQSIVQTAGRVNRHRLLDIGSGCNIAVLQYNLRCCKGKKSAFIWPGYEPEKGVAQYKQHDLAALLPWENSELLIHAGLRFGGSAFAAADDASITKQIAPWFGTRQINEDDDDDDNKNGSEGLFIRTPIDAWRMSARPYEATPLRERQGAQQRWRIVMDNDIPHYERWEVADRFEKWVPNGERDMAITPAAPNAWLALSPPEMQRRCETASIRPKEGMQAELSAYRDDQQYEYDMGFGIRRK